MNHDIEFKKTLSFRISDGQWEKLVEIENEFELASPAKVYRKILDLGISALRQQLKHDDAAPEHLGM